MRFHIVLIMSCAILFGCQDQLVSPDYEDEDGALYYSKTFGEASAADGSNSSQFIDAYSPDVRATSIAFTQAECPGKPGEVYVTRFGRATLTPANGECNRNPDISIEHPRLGLFVPSGLILIKNGD
ncbi:MAG: hypothetical protein IH951_13760 [Bacteroidetes bacterium]|nr:hypothetical protein [Bacteroidota bacterium]